jgi:hypothetical protein
MPGLYHEPMTTFGATPGQDFAAVGGGHACAEAVGACAAEVARLEGSFHGVGPARETDKEKLKNAGGPMGLPTSTMSAKPDKKKNRYHGPVKGRGIL